MQSVLKHIVFLSVGWAEQILLSSSLKLFQQLISLQMYDWAHLSFPKPLGKDQYEFIEIVHSPLFFDFLLWLFPINSEESLA